MDQYVVLARKYRPEQFGTLIGQDNIAITLKNSILRGQLAHAYLFCGPRGVGKTTTARIFAKMINCSNPKEDMEPCGQCESCQSFAEGRSYCIHELDAASNNGVDDIKELLDQVRIPPQVGKYSVFIIDEVHMLSTSAFNAFLKTLEEPPAHAIFILATTEKHKILPTILSRCQTYDFNRITIENIVKNLKMVAEKESITIDEESLHVIAQKADGAMRDALTIFDQTIAFCGTDIHYADVIKNLNVLDYEYSFKMVDAFLSGDYPTCFISFDDVLNKGFNALHFVSALSTHLRNLVVVKSGGMDALLEVPDSIKSKFKEQSQRCSIPFLYEALNITTSCEAGYRASTNPRLHIEFALMRLCFIIKANIPTNDVAQSQAALVQQASGQQLAAAQQALQTQPAVQSQPQQQTTVQQVSSQQQALQPQPAVQSQPQQQTAVQQVSAQQQASGQQQQVAQQKGSLATEPRVRGARKVKTISLSTITEDNNFTDGSGVGSVDKSVPSDEYIQKKWPELTRYYQDKPRLSSLIENTSLEIQQKEDGTKLVTFKVMNLSQKDWIEKSLLKSLEANFHLLLDSTKVSLAVSIDVEEDKPRDPYMPSDQANVLMTENAEVRDLVMDLKLEIK